MPSFSYGIISIILLSLYMVFLSTISFHKYTYLNHFPLLVNFSFLYKTITTYLHFLLSEINYSSPLHEDMPYLWFGGGLGRFRTKYLFAFIFYYYYDKIAYLWQMLKCFQVIAWSMFLQKKNKSINQYEGFDGRLYKGSE